MAGERSEDGLAAWWPVPAILAVAALAAFAPQLLNDGDTFWHLATGEWILRHRAVPFADPFSWSMAGRDWHAHEWLAELLMALAWRAAGWNGLHLLFAGAAAALAAVLAGEARRWLAPPRGLLALALVFGCVAASLLARPHLLALPILALWTRTLVRAADEGAPPPWRLLPLMIVWANLHGSFVLGLLIAAPLALEAARGRPGLARWAGFGAAAALAACLNPRGAGAFLLPLQIMHMQLLPQLAEWQPADFSHAGPFEVALLVTLFALLRGGVRVPPWRLVLLLLLVHLALAQVRQQPVLACVALLLLARPLGEAQPAPTATRATWPVLAPALALLAGLRLLVPATLHAGPTAPIAALAAVPPALRAQPVFNDYGMGGYLILHGVRPYVDGRADMYGDAFAGRAIAAAADPARLLPLLDRERIAWTILPPDTAAERALDRAPGWRRLHVDAFAVVHMRTATP